ncbi:hypothetical protein DPMN_069746 [Dreissena polymorpha]|uniref:Uncharacterized protein n=1 Tax=Dreissena polymorpha TaxID=45954 RepID=A0A9D3Z1Q5_DREPO|nr:hypothetical protein DPMN_069746 [Dreissena polymorpha]
MLPGLLVVLRTHTDSQDTNTAVPRSYTAANRTTSDHLPSSRIITDQHDSNELFNTSVLASLSHKDNP